MHQVGNHSLGFLCQSRLWVVDALVADEWQVHVRDIALQEVHHEQVHFLVVLLGVGLVSVVDHRVQTVCHETVHPVVVLQRHRQSLVGLLRHQPQQSPVDVSHERHLRVDVVDQWVLQHCSVAGLGRVVYAGRVETQGVRPIAIGRQRRQPTRRQHFL